MFETRLAVKTSRQGKRYKDWLFGRVRPGDEAPHDTIQGGASLIMRDVVRDYLHHEFLPEIVISLDAQLGASECDSLTLRDLLPSGADPADQVARREYEEIAREYARHVFPGMGRHERVAVLAKARGLPLNDPDVTFAAGCGKTTLNRAYRLFLQRMAGGIRLEFPDDPPRSLVTLTQMAMEEAKRLSFLWGKAEKTSSRFFMGLTTGYGRQEE